MDVDPPRLPLEAAIIDLDGTLVDTLGDFTVAVHAMQQELGLAPLPPALIGRLVGKGSEHLVRSVLLESGGDADRYPQAWAAYQQHYGQVNGRHAQPYPGAADALAMLRAQGLRLCCVTNKPGRFARELLQAKGLASLFEQVWGGDAFERKKPDPLPLLKACEALGTAPARTVVVGDSSNDAQAARAAGCPVVLVTWGYNHGEPVHAVDADGYLSSWSDLPRTLRRLFPASPA